MNILVFSWRDLDHPMSGGAEQVVHEHMKGWIKAGHVVTHFSSRIEGARKSSKYIDGVRMIRMGHQILGVNILGVFWYLFGNHEKFDLVVDEFHGIPFFTPFFVKAKKIAILQEVAREVWLKNHLPIPFNYLLGVIGYFMEPFIFLFYRNIKFMVGSESAKSDLVLMGIPKNSVDIVPHGVVLPKINKAFSKEKTKTIIFLGALARDKGIEDAIRVFSILNKNGKYNFWIVGKGGEPYTSSLKNLVKAGGVLSNTKFWGFVPINKKFELLSRSHILINPSIREGWGLVNIEANAMGVPVVAYRVPGSTDSVRDRKTGILIEKGDTNTMASAIHKLIEDKSKYRRFSKNSMHWAKEFDWKRSSLKSAELINRIIDKAS